MSEGKLTNIRGWRFYRPMLWLAASVCLLLLVWLGSDKVTDPEWLRGDDYVEYWSAGRLNFMRGNPYDPDQLIPLQQSIGKMSGIPVMMWNPPWMLMIAMPFGALSYPISRTIWMLFNVIIVFYCVNSLWEYFGGSREYRYLSWLIGFTFYPVLETLKSGQANPLLLLCVTGFLLCVRNKKNFLAGVFLSLLILKPHLLYLFSLAAFFWIVKEKRWFILLGALASFIIGTFVAWIVNPQVINQYLFAIQSYPPTDWVTPTIGGLMRFLLAPDLIYLQFIAPMLGIIWFIFYWVKYRSSWEWSEQGPTLVLVSVFSAAYGWSSDQVVSVIALIQIGTLIILNIRSPRSYWVVFGYLVIDVLAFLVRGNAIIMVWLAPALLIWYLAAKRILVPPKALTRSLENQ